MMPPRYRVEAESPKAQRQLNWLECDDLTQKGAEWVVTHIAHLLDDSAGNLGLKIVEVKE